MRRTRTRIFAILLAAPMATAFAQAPVERGDTAKLQSRVLDANADSVTAVDWAPAAWASLGERAEVRNGFVLDRAALGAVAALMPDADGQARPVVRKLDGIGVRLYRFHDAGQIDAAQLELVRQAYHARGWQHVVTAAHPGELPRNTITDLWLSMSGVEVRGGAMLIVTPKSASLISFAGDLSPIDLLHLRGHFGIPKLSADDSAGSK